MSKDFESRRRSVTEQAAHWFVRCAEGGLTELESKALQQWLEASSEHRSEFVQMLRVDAMLALGMGKFRRRLDG